MPIIYLFLISFPCPFYWLQLSGLSHPSNVPGKYSDRNKHMCVLPHSFREAELGFFLAAVRALGKRFEATQLSRCAAAAGECCSQQLLQLQSLPISEQQWHCSITMKDPTVGLLLPSRKQFLISHRSDSLFYFINYRLSCESFHMPALGVMVCKKSH